MPSTIVDEIQIALFPTDFEILNPALLGATLLKDNFISENKLIINSFLSKDAPSEVVRLECILNENPDIQIKIAQSKISIHYINPRSDESFKVEIKDIKRIINKIYELILNGKSFNRIGYITTIIKVVDDPIRLLNKNIVFNNSEPLNEAEVKLTYKTEFADWSEIIFNKHISIWTGYLIDKPEEKAIVMQYDLNVKQGQLLDWDINEALKFIEKSYLKSEDPTEIFNEILTN